MCVCHWKHQIHFCTKVKHTLPASKNFVHMFDTFLDEVKGSGEKKGAALEVGAFPKRFQPRMSSYELEDRGSLICEVVMKIFGAIVL